MEKLNGHNQESLEGNFREANLGRRNSYGGLVCLCLIPFLSACAAIKKTALIAGASSIGAGAGSLLSGSVGAVAGAATGATAGVIATGISDPEPLQATEIIADTVVNQAPDNFFTLIQKLTEMGGWLLILIFVVPMVIGWVLPGPLERKKKKALSE